MKYRMYPARSYSLIVLQQSCPRFHVLGSVLALEYAHSSHGYLADGGRDKASGSYGNGRVIDPPAPLHRVRPRRNRLNADRRTAALL